MYKIYLFLCSLLCVLASCSGGYHVKGTSSVSVVDGKMIYLKSYTNNTWSVIDSSEIVHGTFEMKGTVDSACIVSIFMDGESYMPMVLEEGVIEMSITPSGFVVKGTELNDKLYAFIRSKGELDEQILEATRIENRLILDGASAEEAQSRAEEKVAEITRQVQKLTKDFITENYTNVLGPSVFLMVCGSSFPYPFLTEDLQTLYDAAPESFRENVEVKEYVARAHENMQSMRQQMQARQQQLGQQMPVPSAAGDEASRIGNTIPGTSLQPSQQAGLGAPAALP